MALEADQQKKPSVETDWTYSIGEYSGIKTIEYVLEQGFGSRFVHALLCRVVVEHAIEYKAFIFVAFGTWRHETAFNECFVAVRFGRIKAQDAIVYNLDYMPERSG